MTTTMTSAASSLLQPQPGVRPDGEQQVVARLIETAAQAGVCADPSSVVNFYVALKSKPLAILAGPGQSGKIALVRSLAQVLTGSDRRQCQMMTGHAWWAGQSCDVALFTAAQTRLNTEKILALIEEAWATDNAERVFIACLTRVSPAELMGFFSEVAFQLRRGHIIRLPAAHLTEPIPYPPNLFLIGTMDIHHLDWSDDDLLAMTSIIPWQAGAAGPALHSSQTRAVGDGEGEFLHSLVRDEQTARLKLQRILRGQLPAIWPLIQIEALLRQHAIRPRPSMLGEAQVYLANAWTRGCAGLFDPSPSLNLETALDWSIAQTILPRAQAMVRKSAALRPALHEMLNGRFLRSAALLESAVCRQSDSFFDRRV